MRYTREFFETSHNMLAEYWQRKANKRCEFCWIAYCLKPNALDVHPIEVEVPALKVIT